MTTEQDKVAEFVSYLKERISTVRATAKEYSYAAHLLDNQDLYRISVEDVDEALTHIASLQTELAKHKASHDPLVAIKKAAEEFRDFAHEDLPKGFIPPEKWFNRLKDKTGKIKAALAAAEEGK